MPVINPEIAVLAGLAWTRDEDGYPQIREAMSWEDIAKTGNLVESFIPPTQVKTVNDRLWQDPKLCALEWECCKRDPWRFFTRWVWTFDAQDLKNPIKRFPTYRYLWDLTEIHRKRWEGLSLEHPNLVTVKPRAVLHSIFLASKDLHALVFRDHWSGYMMSLKLRRVDDGGHRSSPNSLFGKVRFSYNLLPEWMRGLAPLEFNQGIIRNAKSGAVLHAEVAGDETGVGMQVDEGDIDEAGVIDNLEEILAVAEPGARFLTVGGTPRAAGTAFHRLVQASPHETSYIKREIDWYMVPSRRQCKTCGSTTMLKATGTMPDAEGVPVAVMIEHVADMNCDPTDGCYHDPHEDRWTSPWFIHATKSMSEDMRRREFEREFHRVAVGRVFKQLRRSAHLIDIEQAPIGATADRFEFWDHGINDATAIWHGMWDGSVFYFLEFFEATNETAAWYCRRKAWLSGEMYSWANGQPDKPLVSPTLAVLYRRLWGEPNRHHGLKVTYFGDRSGANRESDGLSWHRRFNAGAKFSCVDGNSRTLGKIKMLKAARPLIEDRIETCKWAIESGRVMFVQDPALSKSRSDVERGFSRIEQYHRPLDRSTGLVKQSKPVHDSASHGADAFGYCVVHFFGVRQAVYGIGGGALGGN